MSALEASLAPIERYALRVRTEVDPYYSLYFRTEEQRREEVEAAGGDLDIETIEGGKVRSRCPRAQGTDSGSPPPRVSRTDA